MKSLLRLLILALLVFAGLSAFSTASNKALAHGVPPQTPGQPCSACSR